MATLFYPPNLVSQKDSPSFMEFSFFERKSPKDSFPIDTIQLYMPELASQPSTVSWDHTAFGVVGAALSGQGNSGLSWEGAKGAAKMIGQAGAERGMSNFMATIGNLMGGRVSAEDWMGQVRGVIPNPYLTMIFKGVSFREFSFDFKFFPFQEKDCDTIDEIIRTFRAHALPPGEAGSPMLKYPNEVEIKYMWKDKPNKWLHGFKRSVITAIDVDYTPNGMFSVMRNGFPSCIELKMKFSEIEIVLRDDVLNGKNGVRY